jgi:hypothetical protein
LGKYIGYGLPHAMGRDQSTARFWHFAAKNWRFVNYGLLPVIFAFTFAVTFFGLLSSKTKINRHEK